MAQRKSSRLVSSEQVQGEGSFVKIRAITLAEADAMRDLTLPDDASDPTYRDKQDAIFQKLATIVLGWDWVDDDGKPLPQPGEEWKVFYRLTTDEMQFLNGAMLPSTKN